MLNLKTIGFGGWLYISMARIWGYYKRIGQYKEDGNIEAEIEESRRVGVLWGKRVLEKARINLSVEQLGEVPEGPVLFVSNHQGYGDIPVLLAAIDKQKGFIAKETLGKIPALGKWIKRIGSLFLPRDDVRESLRIMDTAAQMMKQGFSMVVFPEGTRSRSDNLGEFKKGSLKMAIKAKIPIVPITISGSYKLYEETGSIVYGNTVDVAIHPPIDTETLTKEEAKNLTDTVEQIIKTKLEDFCSKRSNN